jgi:uncharacterized protein
MIGRILRIALGAIVVAALAFWLLYIPSQVAKAVRHPLETTPASAGLAYEDASFPAHGDGLTIRAWWMPAAAPRAVLVWVHGANANRRDLHARGLEIAKFLVGRGISVLAPDLRNHGVSDGTSNERLTMGYDEANDVIGAVDYATRRAPGLPVYLMGVSMGGATVLYAAARDPRVKKLVVFDPVLDAHATTLDGLYAILGWPKWSLVPVRWSAETFFPGDPGHHNALDVAEKLDRPVLAVIDDKDPVCPPAYAYALAKANPHVTLWVAHDPDAGDPAMAQSGRWGAHAAAYRLRPREMEAALTRFLQ